MILVLERRTFSTSNRSTRKAARAAKKSAVESQKSLDKRGTALFKEIADSESKYEEGFNLLEGKIQSARDNKSRYSNRNNKQGDDHRNWKKAGGAKNDFREVQKDRRELSKQMGDINTKKSEVESIGKEYKNLSEVIKQKEKESGNIAQRGYDYIADTWESGKAGKAKVIAGGTLAAAGLAAGGYYGYKALKKRRDRRRQATEETEG